MNIYVLGMSTKALREIRDITRGKRRRELDWLIASRELYERNGIDCVAKFK